MEMTHFTQQTFRTLMDCFARPGKKEAVQPLHTVDGLYPETLSVLMTLLDGEVSFQTVGEEERLQRELRAWTGAKVNEFGAAEFIIVPAQAKSEQVLEALAVAKIGDLIDPQQSATFVMEVAQAQRKTVYKLTGPGIQHQEVMEIALSSDIVQLRAKRNREFPLGVDLILIDEAGKVLAIPRTTMMKEVSN
ncbi:phosphonate C-P lyase system protein PhnH [Lysinibacillus sp. 54212]|uniref:phosphonate C-P lyase system protein PhnH n=1 Tax=Lysinibacillus sp. 54212 TaxID=3119829 RepID=UPI002FC8090D